MCKCCGNWATLMPEKYGEKFNNINISVMAPPQQQVVQMVAPPQQQVVQMVAGTLAPPQQQVVQMVAPPVVQAKRISSQQQFTIHDLQQQQQQQQQQQRQTPAFGALNKPAAVASFEASSNPALLTWFKTKRININKEALEILVNIGVENPLDLTDLDNTDIAAICDKLNKLSSKRFRAALAANKAE